MSWVAVDGVLVPRERATVSVYDRGFLYGDSIFETLRTYDGKLFRLEAHLSRLARSSEVTRIALPLSVEALGRELVALTSSVREMAPGGVDAPASELVLRVLVTRGGGRLGLLPEEGMSARRVTFVEPFVPPAARLYDEGAKVLCVPTHRPSDAARGAKVGNYLESLLCLFRAREVGCDEALVCDASGHVVEGTTTNVFVVRGGRLVTPPLGAGALPGITRAVTLEVAAHLGVAVEEAPLTPADVLSSDEAFLTSTLREIMPIASIDAAEGRRAFAKGPVTAALARGFRRVVAAP